MAKFKVGDKVESEVVGHNLTSGGKAVDGYTVCRVGHEDDPELVQVTYQLQGDNHNGNFLNGVPCYPVRRYWVHEQDIVKAE